MTSIVWTPDLVRECRNRGFVRLDRMSMAAAWLIGQTFADHPEEVEHYDESGWRPCAGRFAFFLVPTFAYRIRPTYKPISGPFGSGNMKHETQGATK